MGINLFMLITHDIFLSIYIVGKKQNEAKKKKKTNAYFIKTVFKKFTLKYKARHFIKENNS